MLRACGAVSVTRAMSDPSAPSCSSLHIAPKRRDPTQQSLQVQRQSKIASSLLVPRKWTTTLAISKRVLPAPSNAMTKRAARPTGNSWIRAQFADFIILKTLVESNTVVMKEEKITDKDRARCLYSHSIKSITKPTRVKLRLFHAILQNIMARKSASFLEYAVLVHALASRTFRAHSQKERAANRLTCIGVYRKFIRFAWCIRQKKTSMTGRAH